MIRDDDKQPKRPWSGFTYLVIVTIAILAGYYLVLPVGQKVESIFETLTDAFANR